VADTVVVTETRVDVVTVTGSGTTDTIQVTGDKQIEVLTVGIQGPQGPGSVLSPATTTTLGGVIVGDNLSINANGLLSAQAGGVTAFNGRAGNVSLTANDVSNVAGGLYFPLALGVNSGIVNVPTIIPVNTTTTPNTTRSIYGTSKLFTAGSVQYQQYAGISNLTGTVGTALVMGSRYYDSTDSRNSAFRQADLDISSAAINLRSTFRYANGTAYRDMGFGTNLLGMTLYYYDPFISSSIGVSNTGVFIQGKSSVELPPGVSANTPAGMNPLQIMNKDTCDKLYAPFVKIPGNGT
jgi:hypothetical protein